MAKAVKLADIAGQLGVSTVTVSKALSGQKGVSEELREKIKTLADEMGYKQPSARRREHAVKSYNIGVLIAERWLDKYDSFYLQMYQQVATRAVAKECFTLMEVVSAQMEAACEMPKLVQEQKADGLIIIGRLTGEYLNFLNEKAKIPILYMDFCDEGRYGCGHFGQLLWSLPHDELPVRHGTQGDCLCGNPACDGIHHGPLSGVYEIPDGAWRCGRGRTGRSQTVTSRPVRLIRTG